MMKTPIALSGIQLNNLIDLQLIEAESSFHSLVEKRGVEFVKVVVSGFLAISAVK